MVKNGSDCEARTCKTSATLSPQTSKRLDTNWQIFFLPFWKIYFGSLARITPYDQKAIFSKNRRF